MMIDRKAIALLAISVGKVISSVFIFVGACAIGAMLLAFGAKINMIDAQSTFGFAVFICLMVSCVCAALLSTDLFRHGADGVKAVFSQKGTYTATNEKKSCQNSFSWSSSIAKVFLGPSLFFTFLAIDCFLLTQATIHSHENTNSELAKLWAVIIAFAIIILLGAFIFRNGVKEISSFISHRANEWNTKAKK